MRLLFLINLALIAFSFSGSCRPEAIDISKNADFNPNDSIKKLVIVLVDGPRWQETGGDATHTLQPRFFSQIVDKGIFFTDFVNSGRTYTLAGHVSIFTGQNESIPNDGTQLPQFPGLSQLFLEKYQIPQEKVCVLASKDKIAVLANCVLPDYYSKYQAYTDCGKLGLGSGYRADSITQLKALQIIDSNHPDFLFVQYKEPDASGHANNWEGYKKGIVDTDKYIEQLWNKINADPYYAGKTYFIVTNDHGRHSDEVKSGFVSHGDTCFSCRHINMFVSGPGVKNNFIESGRFDQRDLNKTLLRIFGLKDNFSTGRVIKSIMEN
jgi:hypothetical protein